MKPHLTTKKRITEDVSEIIRTQLEFTNGWRITDDDYDNHCRIATKRIIRILKQRKILNDFSVPKAIQP